MAHALVDQLRFTRSEWLRGLEGVSEEDGTYHPGQMNCISWIVGHHAAQEHVFWLERAQSKMLFPQLNEMFKVNAPMSTPALNEMMDIWRKVTEAADVYLDTLTTEKLKSELPVGLRLDAGQRIVGSALQRVIYHYWYHVGEIQSVRQMLGQKNLPAYVGKIDTQAPYRPE
jgi:hypothetical protein